MLIQSACRMKPITCEPNVVDDGAELVEVEIAPLDFTDENIDANG